MVHIFIALNNGFAKGLSPSLDGVKGQDIPLVNEVEKSHKEDKRINWMI